MSRSNAETLGRMFLKNIKPDDLEKAINNNTSLVKLCFNEWHLEYPMVKPIARFVLKGNFKEIETLLTDVPKVFNILAENRSIVPILSSPRGTLWLNKQCADLYRSMYYYTWYGCDTLSMNGLKNPYVK